MVVVTLGIMAAALMLSAGPAQAQASGDAVVAEARSWIGTAYNYGGGYGVMCTEFTSAVYGAFGVSLPLSPAAQYGAGYASGGAAGDLVFYSEGGYGITHVGIATGYGTVIHSSSYFGAVVETPIYAVPGYVGAVSVL